MRTDRRHVHGSVIGFRRKNPFDNHSLLRSKRVCTAVAGGLASFSEPFSQEIIEFGNSEDFVHRGIDVVFHASKLELVLIHDHVATSPIAVARLANTADVDHGFLIGQRVAIVQFFGTQKLHVQRKDTRSVRVTLEAVVLDHGEEFLHFSPVVDILRENVLVDWVSDRTVNEQDFFFHDRTGEFRQEGQPGPRALFVASTLELLSGPENRLFGSGAEAFGIDQGTIVVIAENARVHFHDAVQAFAGVGAVTDHITQADDAIALLILDIRENRLEGFEVAMNVAYDCRTHVVLPSCPKPIAEHVIELIRGVDLLDRFFEIVRDPAKMNFLFGVVDDRVAGAIVFVSGLSNASDVDHQFFFPERKDKVALVGTNKLKIGCEDSRHVRVPLEAILRHLLKHTLHLVLVVDRLRKDVLIGSVAGGSVNEEEFVLDVHPGEFAQEIPPAIYGLVVSRVELIPGPVDGAERYRVESIRIDQCSLVVIP